MKYLISVIDGVETGSKIEVECDRVPEIGEEVITVQSNNPTWYKVLAVKTLYNQDGNSVILKGMPVVEVRNLQEPSKGQDPGIIAYYRKLAQR